MGKKLILYDLDGTLVDTSRDIVGSMNYLLAALGEAPLSPKEILNAVGSGVRELVTRCAKIRDPEQLESAAALYREHYAKHLLDESRLYPWALEILESFKSKTQSVITNKPNPFSRQILEGLGVAFYFSEIIAGDAEHPKKPDPSSILFLAKKHGVSLAETLLIGDSAIDVAAGRNAGIDTVAVLHGFSDERELEAARPQIVAENLGEVISLAKKRAWIEKGPSST